MEKKNKGTEYSIEIPKQEKYFFLIRNFLENILSLEKVSEKESDEIVLAVNEASDKLFSMHQEGQGNIKVDIRIIVNPKKIIITLRHRGLKQLSMYFKKRDEERIVMDSVKSKIGEYLMEKNADEVSFSSSKRKGHQVKIIKYRNR